MDRTHAPHKFQAAILGAVLVLLTLVVYLPVYDADWIWDDDSYVTENEALRDIDGLKRIWTDTSATPQYYPLTHTSFWLQYQVWGLSPGPYHAANVLLHGIAALLLWLTLKRIEVRGAWLAALLFALHPVHVESVAWVTERKNVLSGALYLAAAYVYLTWVFRTPARRGVLRPLGAGALFVGALFSKTVTATLPLALLLVLAWRGRLTRKDSWFLVPMLAAGALLGRVTARLEQTQVLAVGPDWDHSLVERVLIACRALWFYLGKLVWPFDLAFVYPRWEIDASSPAQWLWPVATVALGVVFVAAARKGRSFLLVAALFFGVTLGPALGFVNIYPMRYSFVADHFQYLASIGPLVLVAALIVKFVTLGEGSFLMGGEKGSATSPWRRVAPAMMLLALAVLTADQARGYHDAETLWRTTIEANPAAWMPRHNLGRALQDAGDLDGAAEQFREAIASKPDLVEALTALGTVEIDRGRPVAAIEPLQRAVELAPRDRTALYNLGVALQRSERFEDAVRVFADLVQRAPGMGPAQYNLSLCLFYTARYEAAGEALTAAVRAGYPADPTYMKALREARR